ncbi:hypothetical protein LJC56_11200 [Christensenellaceae bacterium OttesenSCG-928-K19]|nr:hypothetical protein [Christensenellaceae bacterium OttesenSCG-928-K19]
MRSFDYSDLCVCRRLCRNWRW